MTEANGWLQRLRNLLAKAESPGVTSEEAKALREKALSLAAKFEIDEAELWAKSETKAKLKILTRTFKLARPFRQHGAIANAIYKFCSCELRLVGDREIYATGYENDLERAAVLHASILLQAANELAKCTIPENEVRRTYLRHWYQGFANKLSMRLHELKRQAVRESSDSTGTEVALRDKSQLVKEAVDQRFGTGKSRKSSLHRYSSGKSAGYAAAQKVDLGTSAGIKNSRRELES